MHRCGHVCVQLGSLLFASIALPRFIPTEHLYFDYGFRIGGRWEHVSPELVDAVRGALPRLSELANLKGLMTAAALWEVNLHQAEIRLCIAVLLGICLCLRKHRPTSRLGGRRLSGSPT